jgi:eukaryotic-like serine/threonine-protein kinase
MITNQPRRKKVNQSHFKSINGARAQVIPLLFLSFIPLSLVAAADATNPLGSTVSTSRTANGDWPQASFDWAHSGFNRFETVLTRSTIRHLTQLWAVPISGGIHSSPVISNGKVFIGSGDGHMYALDAATGATLWTGPAQGSLFSASAAVRHGLVFAAALDQPMLAYDADTGEIAWTASNLVVAASPTLKNGVLYVGRQNGTLTALDAQTGTVMWSAGGHCCITNQSPVVDGGRVFQMREDHTLTAYDALSGEQLWSIDAFSVGTVAAAYGMLFYSFFPDVVALDQATGAQLWTAPVASAARTEVPAVANGLVFVTHSQLWALDAWTGAVVWSAPATSAVGPTVANGVVYASSLNGEWDAFDERDGTLLWSVTVDSGCFGTCTVTLPIIANGTLYLAGPDAYLHAFSLPTQVNHTGLDH